MEKINLTSDKAGMDIMNATGQIVTYNGGQYRVSNPGNGTRDLTPVSAAEQAVETAKTLNAYQVQQNQPVIQSMQNSIPTTQAAYDQRQTTLNSEKTNLESRYQSVLQDLTARENKAVSTAQTATAQEFGKRGIPLSSGAFDQYQAGQVNPITETYGATRASTGADFADLSTKLADAIGKTPIEKQQAVDAINQAIAQLQSGDPAAAIQGALQLQQLQQQANESAADLALRTRAQDFAESNTGGSSISDQYKVIPEGNTIYDLLNGKSVYTAPKTYKDVQSSLGGW